MSYEYNYWPRLDMDPGPWRDEPDHLQFEHYGLACLIVRNPRRGVFCGYVGVPPDHPLHGADSDAASDAPAHMGVNFTGACEPGGLICHVPGPDEPEPWWFGFDCAYVSDLTPGVKYEGSFPRLAVEWEVYRDLEYVREVCRSLAEWLATTTFEVSPR